MAFEFKITAERKPPSEYGGSPHKALLAEISDFAKQHRRHSLRRYAGLDPDEPESPSEAVGRSVEECEACKRGECDDPEHMDEESKGKLAELLGDEKHSG